MAGTAGSGEEGRMMPTAIALGQHVLPLGGRVPLVRVEPCRLKDAWPTLVKHHYLHRQRTMAQLAYAVMVRGVCDGFIIYCLPFGSGSRDGVPSMQCLELARLWLASNVPFTASGAIMASLKRVRGDWAAQYPHLPAIVAVCSYADEERHTGAIYRHAGFADCGGGKGGHKPGSREYHPDLMHTKRLFMYRWEVPA